MREVVYLKVDRGGVRGMSKNLPRLNKGEYPIKLNVEVKSEAFREPLMEIDVIIEDWRQGLAFPDVDLKNLTITREEADRIVAEREAQVIEDLRARGYEITKPTEVQE